MVWARTLLLEYAMPFVACPSQLLHMQLLHMQLLHMQLLHMQHVRDSTRMLQSCLQPIWMPTKW